MASWSRILIEPIYRLIFGRPLTDRLPWGRDDDHRDASQPIPEAGRDRAEAACRGLVVVVGGVGGLDLCGISLRYVMAAEGLPYAIHVFPWGHGFGRWFSDLASVTNRDLKAGRLADLVRRFRAGQPADPVFLVAKSGGCGVVVKALERLDEGSVLRAILLAPALSPDYDLTAALRAVAGEMVVFWSPLDVVVLGAGTRIFGTADRVRTFSAGHGRLPSARDDDRGRGRPRPRRPVRQAAAGALGAADGRRPATWADTWGRIRRFFSRIMSCPCCGRDRTPDVESPAKIKPARDRADIHRARASGRRRASLRRGHDRQGLKDREYHRPCTRFRRASGPRPGPIATAAPGPRSGRSIARGDRGSPGTPLPPRLAGARENWLP